MLDHDTAVCNFPSLDNLKGTMLVQWQILIQEKFLSNDYFAKECSSEHFSQACCRQTVVKETSSPGTFLPHAVLQSWNLSEHHFLEQAATCNIPWHEKLLGTMKTMSIYWPFLSQREYKRSDHLDMNCNSKQMTGGSGARIPLTVLLVPFECRSPFGEIMLGGNAYQLLMVQIAAAFPSDLPAKYLFDDAIGPVHHLIQKPIVAKLHQHVTEPRNYFALFQPKSPRPLNIIILAQLSFFSKKAIGESLLDKKVSWMPINFEAIVLPDNKSSMFISLLSTRKWSVAGDFLLDMTFSILRCPSQDVVELDGMVVKVEQISHMDKHIHQLVQQQMSLPDSDENASMHEHIKIAIVHKSWDPGSVAMPAYNPRSLKILMSMLTSHEAQAMSGMSFSQCCDEEHFQEVGNAIVVVLAAGLVQGYVDHKYYINVYNDYFRSPSATTTTTSSFKSTPTSTTTTT
ncbi:uncharacterized protein [Triticum aestivum]|uniref:uncharacterized protein isoform X1 n=1 Tax=Triticum aestivum TaxID=4565 RepID=UPI001D0338AC|nr:uncharacterized protein LOC123167967 isoform X1 [Triticum aestivum]XP_044441756.1 uncharacterized protein LOC123167967 isoform X1 [Triticum aestivum]